VESMWRRTAAYALNDGEFIVEPEGEKRSAG
jgi:hypothetical protein